MSASNYKTIGQLSAEQNPVDIRSAEQRMRLLNENRIVVVDVFGYWCGPCLEFAPRFAALAHQWASESVTFAKEEVDLKLTPVKGVPAFLFYVDGEEREDLRMLGGNAGQIDRNLQALHAELEIELPVAARDARQAVSVFRQRHPAAFPNKETIGS